MSHLLRVLHEDGSHHVRQHSSAMAILVAIRDRDAVSRLEDPQSIRELYLEPPLDEKAKMAAVAPMGLHLMRILHQPQDLGANAVDLVSHTRQRTFPRVKSYAVADHSGIPNDNRP